MTTEEYYERLKKYNYIRELRAFTMPPESEPVSIRFFIRESPYLGFYPDYHVLRIFAGRKQLDWFETLWHYPAFDAFLLFFSRIRDGASGLWCEIYNYYPSFVDLSFERYGNSDIGLFKSITPFEDDEVDWKEVPGVSWYDGHGPIMTKSCVVSATQLCEEFFREMRFAYGNRLYRKGRHILEQYCGEDLSYLGKVKASEDAMDTKEKSKPKTPALETISYWNWIRQFPELFTEPQKPLALSDFLTTAEIEKLSPLQRTASECPLPSIPLL